MAELDERDVDPDPLTQFRRWLDAALEAGEAQPTATALATADGQGRPSVRMVLCKSADERGFTFFTNTASRKGQELAVNPHAALAFWWATLGRQVTARGGVRPVSAEESDAYWVTRPRGSQLSAAASPQSQPVPARAELEQRVRELARAYETEPVPRPPYWGGYLLAPDELVFWQHREDRLHDRVRYTRAGDGWAIDRLAP